MGGTSGSGRPVAGASESQPAHRSTSEVPTVVAACAHRRTLRTVTGMATNPSPHAVHFSSATDDWPTPQDFFDRLNLEFGGFSLDVCASNANHKAPKWFGHDHAHWARRDALKRNWTVDAGGAPIWMNPPYGRAIKPFMEKAVQEARRGATVVCLVPARTDTAWWHESTHEAQVRCDIRFVKGRLKFGDGTGTAPFPSAVIVLGPLATGHVSAMSARKKVQQMQPTLFDLAPIS